MTAGTSAAGPTSVVEVHSIDYIPQSERHGKVTDQFTLWFLGLDREALHDERPRCSGKDRRQDPDTDGCQWEGQPADADIHEEQDRRDDRDDR